MQYIYLKQAWESLTGSLLLLNNGFQKFETDGVTPDGVNNLQTLGTHLDYKKDSFGVAANAYLQTGDQVKSAYLLGLDVTYKASQVLKLLAVMIRQRQKAKPFSLYLEQIINSTGLWIISMWATT